MTVSSTLNKHIYIGNDVTKTFDYTFYTLSEGDLKLYLTNITTGAVTEVTTNYDVFPYGGEFPSNSGTVTYPIAGDPITSNDKFTIVRTMDVLQPTVYPNNASLKPKVVEKSFDRITMIAQQQQEEIDRTLKLAITTPDAVGREMPSPNANNVIGWNSTGTALENKVPSGIAMPTWTETLTAGGNDYTNDIKTASIINHGTIETDDIITNGPWVDVRAYGAIGDGSTDNISFFTALSTYVNGITGDNPVNIFIPPMQFNYTGGLVFTRPVKIIGYGSTLNYTGAGIAIKLGIDGLNLTNYIPQSFYEVYGVRFTGGNIMTHGVYFNEYITCPRIIDCTFDEFGNTDAWGVFFQGHNWDSYISNCNSIVNTKTCNWIKTNGVLKSGVSDNGQSRLRMTNCLGHCLTADSIGIYVNGVYSEISSCKIEGFSPNILLAENSNGTWISNVYFECSSKNTNYLYGGNILYGGAVGSSYESNVLYHITIENVYCNTHNLDSGYTNYLLAPISVNSGIEGIRLNNVRIGQAVIGTEIVKLNNIVTNYGNFSEKIFLEVASPIHTIGSNIKNWLGGDDGYFIAGNNKDEPLYFYVKGGKTANQYSGVSFLGYDGTEKMVLQYVPGATPQANIIIGGVSMVNAWSNGEFQFAQGLILLGKQVANTSTGLGTLFEDTDGKLKYKNLAGALIDLTL